MAVEFDLDLNISGVGPTTSSRRSVTEALDAGRSGRKNSVRVKGPQRKGGSSERGDVLLPRAPKRKRGGAEASVSQSSNTKPKAKRKKLAHGLAGGDSAVAARDARVAVDREPEEKAVKTGQRAEGVVVKATGRCASRNKEVGPSLDKSFDELGLHEVLKRQLLFLNFTRCTPIQALAVPVALQRKDVMLRAATGSGKTLAFLLPALDVIISKGCRRQDGTMAVILSPTKELALQTLKVAFGLVRMVPNIVCGSLAGGERPKNEKASLRKGLALICATPGRLAYHLENTQNFKRDNLQTLVLDEADRLLDMGFEPQIRKICKQLRSGDDRSGSKTALAQLAAEGEIDPKYATMKSAIPMQTLLCSATLTPSVRRLGEFCLRKGARWVDPDDHTTGQSILAEQQMTGSANTKFSFPPSLTQWYCEVPCKERLPALVACLLSRSRASSGKKEKAQKAIVFLSSCSSVDFHHDMFLASTWPSRSGKAREDAKRKVRKIDGFVGYEDPRSDEQEDDDDQEGEDESGEGENADGSDTQQVSATSKVFAEVPLFKLHGNLSAEERAGHIADFGRSVGGALLASDAASRGLDFPHIDWVIQYDPPQYIEEYMHKAGRTARIGREGNSLIFLMPSELGFLDLLRDTGAENIRRLDLEGLHRSLLSSGAPRELALAKDLPTLMLAQLKRIVEENRKLATLARAAFLAALRSYGAFSKDLRKVFKLKELHMGHFATSFALRETPKEVMRFNRAETQVSEEKGGGKGKRHMQSGTGGGKGKGFKNKNAKRQSGIANAKSHGTHKRGKDYSVHSEFG